MGNPKGFMEIKRKEGGNRPIHERVLDYGEVEQTLNEDDRILQAARCMDCGIPFCQWGCPIMNNMPEWQHAIYKGDWKKASDLLHITNNFPEFTGRICPAPCEKACVLGINEEPVTIRENEAATAENAFEQGHIKPKPPKVRTGKTVAVIGSGPAGLACADLLNKAGHAVTLFEKDEAVGGLLRFGIPDFKLAKNVIDRRIDLLMAEGLIIKTNTEIGKDISGDEILKSFDVVVLAIGAMKPRDIAVEGRNLKGIHFAMDFLTQQNRIVQGVKIEDSLRITAENKNILVIGGGDTGSDCIGTSTRQKAKSVTSIEILPKPSEKRTADNPWPYWATTLKTSSSHEEGCERFWSLATKRFLGANGNLSHAEVVEVLWEKDSAGVFVMKEIEGTKRLIETDLVLLSLGFLHPIHEGLVKEFELELDKRGNIQVNKHSTTNKAKVFATGDSITGASLVVRAIASGRKAAENINDYLKMV
jgi:glutamate synthase (NADPH/NADH) small chain